jgi:hypothetical protein
VRRLALLVAALVLVGALAACGGSGGSKGTTTSGANAQEQIKSAFVKFFSNKTPLAQRVELLQNGSQFKPIIEALAKNPLASNTSATVKSVKLEGGDKASVVYTVYVGGTPLPQLKNRTGTAVKVNGKWQVGDASFCSLVKIGGSPPAVCNHST